MADSGGIDAAVFGQHEDRFVLTVLSKRTFDWTGGVLALSDEPEPIAQDITLAQRDDRNGQVVTQGRDTWPVKYRTDVVVQGHIEAPAARGVVELPVTLRVGAHERRILALGPRHVQRRANGELEFSRPERLERVELSWWNAYGGIDPHVLPEGLADTPVFAGRPVLELFPGAYPRNPSGVGYWVRATPALLDGLLLPQLEDPQDRLRPQALLTGDTRRWWRQPQPAAWGWVHALWFPRVLHAGGKPYHLPPATWGHVVCAEVAQGRIRAEQLSPGTERKPSPWLAEEAALSLPLLSGAEWVEISGHHPDGPARFQLPNCCPRVSLRCDAVRLEPEGRLLHSLTVDLDRRRLSLLWATRFRVPDELGMDLALGAPVASLAPRCEIRIDQRLLEPHEWPRV